MTERAMLATSCTIATSGVIAWSLLAAACAHEAEEFVWPGGFRAWYISYKPHVERSMTMLFLVGINVMVLIAAAAAALWFASPSMRFLWLALAGALGINGAWHLQATIRARRYSPGVITGALLYIPLFAYACVHFVRCGWVSPHNAVAAFAYGAAYWIISEGRKLLKREPRAAEKPNLSVLR